MTYLYNVQLWIWLALYIFFTELLYFYGIKGDWQKIRISRGLVDDKSRNAPKCYEKYQVSNKRHIGNCLRLNLMSFFMSFIIMIFFYYTSSTKEIKDIFNFISVFLSLLFIYLVVCGAPLGNMELPENDKDKMYAKIINSIAFIKSKLISSVVNNEYQFYEKNIITRIQSIYENQDKVKIGALIIRINSEFFNEMLPENIDSTEKEHLKDYAFKLLTLYREGGNLTLFDELDKLFRDKIFKHNAKMSDIARFIDNLEITSKKIKQKEIDAYIEKQVMQANRTTKTKSLSQLNTILDTTLNFQMINTECSTEHASK